MDDNLREPGASDKDSPQKLHRKRRTPSGEPLDVRSRRRTPSHSRSKSRSPSRERGRRRRSRSRSPDRRYGRQNRGGYQRDFNRRNRRSPSRSPDRFRGRNRNGRRSRSTSYDRYRNRRNMSTSRERSMSQRRENSRPPQPSNFQTEYIQPPGQPVPFQADFSAQPYPNQQQQYPNYDYQVPMIPPVSNSYPQNFSAPPPPVIGDFQASYSVPPPPIISLNEPKPQEIDEEKQKRDAAIALEKKNQRDTLCKQRDDYMRRATALKRELSTLREQRGELMTGSEPPSPTTNGFLRNLDRLQTQIENKIHTIQNVIDMLDGIINADKTESPKKEKNEPKSDDSSPERLKTKVIESLSRKRKDSDRSSTRPTEEKSVEREAAKERVNYTFYDPEQHWCKACSSFPKTAKEYLGHLHSEEHKANVKPPEIPWHEHIVNDEMPSYPGATVKRTPIRGLQFFVPATAWYCKICSFWIGDLHCASSHLKSKTHAREYDKFIQKNPNYEFEWRKEREKALEIQQKKENETKTLNVLKNAPPPPPMISSQSTQSSMTLPAYGMAGDHVFDSIPLQINQRSGIKEQPITEESDKKKGKKKKKEKKKRKKSKKKHRRSSSSSTSSSSGNSSESDEETERKSTAPPPPPPPPPLAAESPVDTSTSIRVAMRNAGKTHLKPKSDDEAEAPGGWTVIQEGKTAQPLAPQPPTISANGEAQNRRDEMLINQWNAPAPIISEKEKQLLEQLKGKLKSRDEPKKEKSPPKNPIVEKAPLPSSRPAADDTIKRNTDKRRDERDYRRRRSPSTPRRDRDRDRDRRSPRRDRRRRSRSVSPRRDRRSRSRSPKRDRRKRSRSRSRSKSSDRREKTDSKFIPPDRRKDIERKSIQNDKTAKKSSTTSNTPKRLPFIGRMPVLKKQNADDDAKKSQTPVNDISEEEKIIQKKKQDELKFHLIQTKQLLHQQQKQAEAFNLAHPGHIANIYHQHGTIHHVLPAAQEEYDDLMPDPMQYVSLMAPPPPPAGVQQPTFQETEDVLPPGIDEDEAKNMETVVPDVPAKDVLPKDFQDALSIIFDKDKQETIDEQAANETKAANLELADPSSMHDENSTYTSMDIVMDTHEHGDADGQQTIDPTQYMLYGTLTDNAIYGDLQTHMHGQTADMTMPATGMHMDAAGNFIQMPGSVLDMAAEYNENTTAVATNDLNMFGDATEQTFNNDEANSKNKRLQELDDLAMLGIDAGDLAAQCI